MNRFAIYALTVLITVNGWSWHSSEVVDVGSNAHNMPVGVEYLMDTWAYIGVTRFINSYYKESWMVSYSEYTGSGFGFKAGLVTGYDRMIKPFCVPVYQTRFEKIYFEAGYIPPGNNKAPHTVFGAVKLEF